MKVIASTNAYSASVAKDIPLKGRGTLLRVQANTTGVISYTVQGKLSPACPFVDIQGICDKDGTKENSFITEDVYLFFIEGYDTIHINVTASTDTNASVYAVALAEGWY